VSPFYSLVSWEATLAKLINQGIEEALNVTQPAQAAHLYREQTRVVRQPHSDKVGFRPW
jgi:hypothetical protein